MIDADVPAAHSMDTEWFAVDADGHVGHFTTGEDATYPEEGWPTNCSDVEVVSGETLLEYAELRGWWGPEDEAKAERVTELPVGHAWMDAAEAQIAVQRAGFAAALERWQGLSRWRRWLGRVKEPPRIAEYVYDGIMVVDARAPAPAGAVQRVGDVQVVRIRSLTFAEMEGLHAQGRCIACSPAPPTSPWDHAYGRAGIFTFAPEIDYSGSILSPYRRVAAPGQPRRIHEFTAELVRGMNAVVLADARFERDALVQPARTLRCMGYVDVAPAYLDIDLHTVRPQRGMEAEYLKMLDALRTGAPHWRFDVP